MLSKHLQKMETIVMKWPLASLFGIGIVVQFFFWLVLGGEVQLFKDSSGYISLAERITSFDFLGYEFERTPGYPLLIAIFDMNFQWLVSFQILLNVLSALMLFRIAKLMLSERLSFLVALAPVFIANYIFYQQSILTETFSLFLLTSIIYLYFLGGNTVRNKLYIGLLCGGLLMTRTLFLYLAPLIVLYVLYARESKNAAKVARDIALYLGPSVFVFVCWCSFNKQHTGNFSLTPYFGINLAQTTVGFFDRYEGPHTDIKSIYVNHIVEANSSEGKRKQEAIWTAYDELIQETGLPLSELSNVLGRMSIELILENPWMYIKQVVISYTDFWKNDLYWNKAFDNTRATEVFTFWRRGNKAVQLIFNLLFLMATLYYGIRYLLQWGKSNRKIAFMILVIQGAAVLQALVVYGDNSRFSFPFYPLITLLAVYFGSEILNKRKIKPTNTKL